MQKILQKIADYFSFDKHSTTFKKEIIGGVTTFLAMAYIFAVNPGILNAADSHFDPAINNGEGGIVYRGYEGVFFLGTILASFLGTMAMAMVAKIPVALIPGMGVNAFFTYTVASDILGLSLEEALIATFCSGILYAIIALTPARSYIIRLLPKNMKLAIGTMIGLFLAYVGLVNSGIIVSGGTPFGVDADHAGVATPTKLGNFADPFVIVALIVLLLVFVLHFTKVKGAAIIAILVGVIALAFLKAFNVNDADKAFQLKDYGDFAKFGELSRGMWSSFGNVFSNGKFYIALFVFLYIDFFDTTGTLFSVGDQAKLDMNKSWVKKANLVDATATIGGSVFLTSTTTSCSESLVGISQGARTGFASIVTGSMVALTIALWPIMSPLLPIEHLQNSVYAQGGTIMPVTGPILVLVGAMMLSQLRYFEWKQTIDIPMLFFTILFGILSYSISTGIAAGIIVHFIVNAAVYFLALMRNQNYRNFKIENKSISLAEAKKQKEHIPNLRQRVFNPLMITLFILAVVYFATMPLYYG